MNEVAPAPRRITEGSMRGNIKRNKEEEKKFDRFMRRLWIGCGIFNVWFYLGFRTNFEFLASRGEMVIGDILIMLVAMLLGPIGTAGALLVFIAAFAGTPLKEWATVAEIFSIKWKIL